MASNSQSTLKDSSNEIKELKLGFKKILTKFINDSERGVYRKVSSPLVQVPVRKISEEIKTSHKLRRDVAASKSFSGYSNINLSPRSPRINSPRSPRINSPRTSFSKAIALEAYQSAEISPRDMLKLKRSGKSIKDFNNAVSLVSVQLNREYETSESELLLDINRQLNNLRGNSSNISSKISVERKRSATI